MTIRTILITEDLTTLQMVPPILENDPDIEVEIVSTVREEENILKRAREAQPRVAILDVGALPRHIDPVTLVVKLKQVSPSVDVVALLKCVHTIFAKRFVHCETRGCLMLADERILSLNEVVRQVTKGYWIYSQQVLKACFDLPGPMLDQEVEILRLVYHGWTNKAIARELDIAKNTLTNRLSSIYDKLGVPREKGRHRRFRAVKNLRGLVAWPRISSDPDAAEVNREIREPDEKDSGE